MPIRCAGDGGPTLTMAPGAGSPVIDVVFVAHPQSEPSDQRGGRFRQVFGPAADIGAIEVQPDDRLFADNFDAQPPALAADARDP